MGIELSPPAFTTPLGYTYHIGDRISSIELDHIAAVGAIARVDEDHVWQLSRYEIPGIPTGYLYDDLLETTAQIDAMNQALSGTKYIVENTKGMEISPEERFPVETRSMEIALQEMVKTANEVLAALSKSHWEQNRKEAK